MNRAEQRGAAGLQQRQPQQQRQPPQRAESPAPHGEEGGQLGRLLREAAAGSRGNPLLLGTSHGRTDGRTLGSKPLSLQTDSITLKKGIELVFSLIRRLSVEKSRDF